MCGGGSGLDRFMDELWSLVITWGTGGLLAFGFAGVAWIAICLWRRSRRPTAPRKKLEALAREVAEQRARDDLGLE